MFSAAQLELWTRQGYGPIWDEVARWGRRNLTVYLGTHRPYWLWKVPVPLFVSRRGLSKVKKLHRAVAPRALDSGGFTELAKFGRWTITPKQYVEEVRRFSEHIGFLQWAAIQDFMCEPWVINGGGKIHAKGTGLSVEEHQLRTVQSFLELMSLAPDLPWRPVVQGWSNPESYLRCVDLYGRYGVDLRRYPLVGVGSVCRLENTDVGAQIIHALWAYGLSLHGFGFKLGGLLRAHQWLVSSDSLAWSYGAMRRWIMLPGCRHGKKKFRKRLGHDEYMNCANCERYALHWYYGIFNKLNRVANDNVPVYLLDDDDAPGLEVA